MTHNRRMVVRVNCVVDPETERLLTRLAEVFEHNRSQALRQSIRIAAGVMLPPEPEGGKVT
jgi:hypothetical protein